jgi:Glycine transporter
VKCRRTELREPGMETLLLVLDLVGTFVFALSGAVAGVRHRLDLFGVLVLSFAAANTGGITRDLLIGAVPPAAISDWRYLAVSLLAGIVTFWRPSIIARLRSPVLICDAAGLALFAVAGTQKALAFGLKPDHGGTPRHADRDRRWDGPRFASSRDPDCVTRRSLRSRRTGRRRRGRDRCHIATSGDRGDDCGRGSLLRAPVHGYSPRLASSARRGPDQLDAKVRAPKDRKDDGARRTLVEQITVGGTSDRLGSKD